MEGGRFLQLYDQIWAQGRDLNTFLSLSPAPTPLDETERLEETGVGTSLPCVSYVLAKYFSLRAGLG